MRSGPREHSECSTAAGSLYTGTGAAGLASSGRAREGIMLKKRLLWAVLLCVAACAAGCSWNEYWMFSVTRWCLEDGGPNGNGAAEFLLVVVCVDLALLPVTMPHDIWLFLETWSLIPVPDVPAPAPSTEGPAGRFRRECAGAGQPPGVAACPPRLLTSG
jgi:hypothetical protein